MENLKYSISFKLTIARSYHPSQHYFHIGTIISCIVLTKLSGLIASPACPGPTSTTMPSWYASYSVQQNHIAQHLEIFKSFFCLNVLPDSLHQKRPNDASKKSHVDFCSCFLPQRIILSPQECEGFSEQKPEVGGTSSSGGRVLRIIKTLRMFKILRLLKAVRVVQWVFTDTCHKTCCA